MMVEYEVHMGKEATVEKSAVALYIFSKKYYEFFTIQD